MYIKRSFTLLIVFMFLQTGLKAQSDSTKLIKKSFFSQLHLPKLHAPQLHLPKVKWPSIKMPQFKKAKDSLAKTKDSFTKKPIDYKKYIPQLKKEEFYLYAGINLSKQTIGGMDYTIPFNYDFTKVNNDDFMPGYFLGGRWEGKYQNKYPFTIDFGLQKLESGTKYTTVSSFEPFIGEFVHHKADDQMLIFTIGANYKQLIPYVQSEKQKFYLVAGPELAIRLNNQSLDNRVTNSYKKALIRANIGLEMDNNGYYTVFFHFKPSIGSFTHEPIRTSLNSFELGMMLNAGDIF